ncbi:hypothetical protein MAPG_10113 [Magnaporthiopsis poae ATCC 64411]|uniref:Uncharacterized protein n=1 Tax=Magnaporthiopsis poae (strain ATCC 64411 / 73-15) TaxID=644358 RepID=A0A0C4EBQ8_MAGP6|nr:hypothetical protein MAPG_10113 [Magnaporthiopsis poae ATCC 64411]
MRFDRVTSLLFNQPLPVSSISLGRLVRDPMYPDVDYYEPVLAARPIPDTAAKQQLPPQEQREQQQQQQQEEEEQALAPNVAEYRFENFYDTLEAARGTRLELKLLEVLSLASLSSHRSSRTTLRSRLCVVSQLRNADAFFRAVCRGDRGTRAWLESEGLRPGNDGRVYIVCGFKTLTDATVSHSDGRGGGVDVSASVSAGVLAAGAGLPLPLTGDLTATVQTSVSSSEELNYTAPGERVYAVLYRRIRFAWFATRSADNAYLEKGIRWKSLVSSRGGGDEGEDGVQVEIMGGPEPDELEGNFESAEIAGEHVLYAGEDEADE